MTSPTAGPGPEIEPQGPGPLRRRLIAATRFMSRPDRAVSAVLSVGAHVAIVAAIMNARVETPQAYDLRAMNVTMIEELPPADPVTPPKPDKQPDPAKPPPRRSSFRETPPPPADIDVQPMPAGKDKTTLAGVDLSDSELEGASTAGTGTAGGACNMPRLLQNALRKDPLVRAAVANAHRGKAIMVWNGAWVRRPDQEGEGLAAVREAMMWEIAFAPEPCRTAQVHGLVLLSLEDGPGAARIVVGGGDWRWSHLLFSRSASVDDAVLRR